ncbi:hypothetical protein QNH39_26530 [Neobacillus novalis]|uniref:Uncharacterized protein n=1 Tax=Neobacillus novalis TaxID=220687 RepID=A0AA95MT59_9BACI|nr:hypothetical protein [Neobacillus novalis]WHY86088.1 hypothetical protein QNH39_26530 [Neobacillus novalis]
MIQKAVTVLLSLGVIWMVLYGEAWLKKEVVDAVEIVEEIEADILVKYKAPSEENGVEPAAEGKLKVASAAGNAKKGTDSNLEGSAEHNRIIVTVETFWDYFETRIKHAN